PAACFFNPSMNSSSSLGEQARGNVSSISTGLPTSKPARVSRASFTGLADLEENVTARFLADDREAKDCPVEGFRRLEVIDVDGGFDDGLNAHVHAPFNPVPPARHPPGPGCDSSALLSGPAVPALRRV